MLDISKVYQPGDIIKIKPERYKITYKEMLNLSHLSPQETSLVPTGFLDEGERFIVLEARVENRMTTYFQNSIANKILKVKKTMPFVALLMYSIMNVLTMGWFASDYRRVHVYVRFQSLRKEGWLDLSLTSLPGRGSTRKSANYVFSRDFEYVVRQPRVPRNKEKRIARTFRRITQRWTRWM